VYKWLDTRTFNSSAECIQIDTDTKTVKIELN
jgi:hypothetical protein